MTKDAKHSPPALDDLVTRTAEIPDFLDLRDIDRQIITLVVSLWTEQQNHESLKILACSLVTRRAGVFSFSTSNTGSVRASWGSKGGATIGDFSTQIDKCRQLLDMYVLVNYNYFFSTIKMLLRTNITYPKALSTEEIYSLL